MRHSKALLKHTAGACPIWVPGCPEPPFSAQNAGFCFILKMFPGEDADPPPPLEGHWRTRLHCSDTQVTPATVPSSTEVTATTVPFPLLPYDRLRKQEILYQSMPAARHQLASPPHSRATEFGIKLGVPIRATGMMALLGAARWRAAEPANDSAWSTQMTPHGAAK